MSDISVPVIDRVIELQPARLLDVNGFTYIDKDKTVTLFTPPTATVLQLHTLSGFIRLLEGSFEDFVPGNTLVHVESFNEVYLLSNVSDSYGRRQHFVKTSALKPEREFKFNTYQPQEDFNIALRTMFVQDPALDELVQLAGTIAKQTEVQQEDDGFSQRVTAKAGVHLVREKTIKPRVTLKPFRTFLEVDQPSGDFIFRVRHDEDRGNLCALFEADAGRWKLTAMDTIAAWLKQKLTTSDVEAIRTLPVVA